jgi:uncharacterized damage-inducible protein DinB
MLLPTLKVLFKRDLHKLHKEIEAYQTEAILWHTEQAISNSAGNLCLHLIGNLNAFIGAELGDTGYTRDRTFEFNGKNVPRQDLLQQILDTSSMIDQVLTQLKTEQLEEDYPRIIFSEKMSTGFFLVHLATHLNYHLGQINYHRRLLDTTIIDQK